MSTEEQRAIHRRDEDRYPSNLTDAEWERLKPLIPEAFPGGRPRKTDMRAAMNAIFYPLRQGARHHRPFSRSLRRQRHEHEKFARRVKRIVPVGTKGKVISLRVSSLLAKRLQGRETD